MSAADPASSVTDLPTRIRALQVSVDKHRALYADPVELWPPSTAPVLWITGLAGSGKSSLANRLLRALEPSGERPLLLDGDRVRQTLDDAGTQFDHAPASRLRRAWRLLQLAHRAASDQQPVIVATVSLIAEVQQANRHCHQRFAEVLLEASLPLLTQRRPDLYSNPDAFHQVVGCGQSAHFPVAPELKLQPPASTQCDEAQLMAALDLWQTLAGKTP